MEPSEVAFTTPEYNLSMERKIMRLEGEIQRLQDLLNLQTQQVTAHGEKLEKVSAAPKSALDSPNILIRTLTVWGYWALASIVIGLPIFCIMTIVGALLQ